MNLLVYTYRYFYLSKNRKLKYFVHFPNFREQDCIKQEFFDYCGISGALGAIDCTHVSILAPSDDGFHNEKNYVNRKGWHSLNVQIVSKIKLCHLTILIFTFFR